MTYLTTEPDFGAVLEHIPVGRFLLDRRQCPVVWKPLKQLLKATMPHYLHTTTNHFNN